MTESISGEINRKLKNNSKNYDNNANNDVFTSTMNIQNQQRVNQLQHQQPIYQNILQIPLIQEYSVNGFEDSSFGFSNFVTGSMLGFTPDPDSHLIPMQQQLSAIDPSSASIPLREDNDNNDDNYNRFIASATSSAESGAISFSNYNINNYQIASLNHYNNNNNDNNDNNNNGSNNNNNDNNDNNNNNSGYKIIYGE